MTTTLLITPTLLDAFDFASSCPPSWKDRAFTGLLSKIRREPFTMNPAAQKGIDFEATVYKACEYYNYTNDELTGRFSSYSDHFKSVVQKVQGGETQKVFKKFVDYGEDTLLFYCKLDVFFPKQIIDIKTTANYKGQRKYKDGWQSAMYPIVTGVKDMRYLVAEWENEDSDTVINVHDIQFAVDIQERETALMKRIEELFQYIHDNGLYEDYFFKFSNNG